MYGDVNRLYAAAAAAWSSAAEPVTPGVGVPPSIPPGAPPSAPLRGRPASNDRSDKLGEPPLTDKL